MYSRPCEEIVVYLLLLHQQQEYPLDAVKSKSEQPNTAADTLLVPHFPIRSALQLVPHLEPPVMQTGVSVVEPAADIVSELPQCVGLQREGGVRICAVLHKVSLFFVHCFLFKNTLATITPYHRLCCDILITLAVAWSRLLCTVKSIIKAVT